MLNCNPCEILSFCTFRLISRSGGSSSAIFIDAIPGTIFHELYKVAADECDRLFAPNELVFPQRFFENKRDLYMFSTFEKGLENLMRMKKGAYFNIMESVFAVDDVKCDVLMPWKTDYPNLLGMAVPKKSRYYEVLRYQTLRQIEVIFSSS